MRNLLTVLGPIRRLQKRLRAEETEIDGATATRRNGLLNGFLLSTALCCLMTYLAAAGYITKWMALLAIAALRRFPEPTGKETLRPNKTGRRFFIETQLFP